MTPSKLPRKRKRVIPPKGGDYHHRYPQLGEVLDDDDDGGGDDDDEDDGGDDVGRKSRRSHRSRRRLDDNDDSNDNGNNNHYDDDYGGLDRGGGNRTDGAPAASGIVVSTAKVSGMRTTTTSTRSPPRSAARLRAVAASSSRAATANGGAGRAHTPTDVERRTSGGAFLARRRCDDDRARRVMVPVDDDVISASNVDIPRVNGEGMCESESVEGCRNGTRRRDLPHSILPFLVSLRGRRRMRQLQLSLIVACVVSTCSTIALLVLIAVTYANNFEHDLATLRMDAIAYEVSIESNEMHSREVYEHIMSRVELRTVLDELDESQDEVMRLREEMRSDAYAREIENRDHETSIRMSTARIDELGGDVYDYASAKDEAWSRFRELSEENDRLSRTLVELERSRDASRSSEARLMDNVEDLTRRVDAASRDGDELTSRIDTLRAETDDASMRYDVLRRDHEEMSDSYLAPILAYVRGLQISFDRQHSIILDLTSLVHSLRASLEVDRADSIMRASMSIHAVDAVAYANGQLAIERARMHELERVEYMERMEMRLVRLEDEAMGAVVAVAEAAGRLEYERKVEEEGRWRDYTMETESILRSVRDEGVVEDGRRDGVGGGEEGVGATGISSETSLLRAAISRRIEEGMASLRSYYHPYDYLIRGDRTVETITSESDIVNGVHSGGTSGDAPLGGEVHEERVFREGFTLNSKVIVKQ